MSPNNANESKTLSSSPSAATAAAAAAVDTMKASSSSSSSPFEGGDKAKRRRHKKLRKKATTILTGPLSGLTNAEDWQEFIAGRALYDTNSIDNKSSVNDGESIVGGGGGPQIRWRSIKQERQPVQAEGAMQRDLLYYLIDNTKVCKDSIENDKASTLDDQNRKRQREQECNTGKIPLPAWVTIHNVVGISSVVIVEVHLPSATLLQSLRQKLVSTPKSHSHLMVPTRWFNNETPKSISESLLYAAPQKPPKRSKKQAAAERITNLSDLYSTLKTMTLTKEQMTKEGYPVADCPTNKAKVPLVMDDDSINISLSDANSMIQPFVVIVPIKKFGSIEDKAFVTAPPDEIVNHSDHKTGHIYALDCEMVETTAGRALARFTLLQAKEYNPSQKKVTCTVVWDTLVQPDARVTDYLTQWSGVSAESLEKGPTVYLAQVQAFLLCRLRPHDILVGHSLENDLLACRYIHPSCVDTAILFQQGTRMFKYSLRNLTFQLLKRTIQKSSSAHCSEEDAQASLDLAVRRAAEGPSFCIANNRSQNQWTRLVKDRVAVAVGPNSWLQTHIIRESSAVHALSCEGIRDESRKAMLAWVGSKRRADLVWGCFEIEEEEECDAISQFVSELLEKVPTGDTAVGVALQCSYEPSLALSQNRRLRQGGKATLGWTNEEEKRFTELVTESQHGSMIWFSSKN